MLVLICMAVFFEESGGSTSSCCRPKSPLLVLSPRTSDVEEVSEINFLGPCHSHSGFLFNRTQSV